MSIFLNYRTNGKGAHKLLHKVSNLCLIAPSEFITFLLLNRNLLNPSMTLFSYFSADIKTNLILGWTSPLKKRPQNVCSYLYVIGFFNKEVCFLRAIMTKSQLKWAVRYLSLGEKYICFITKN